MAFKKSQRYISLWQSCDKLRGSMDADLKQVILAERGWLMFKERPHESRAFEA